MNDSSHWYDREGNPCHTQATKKGAKNPTRATTVRDARKLDLLGSTSGMLDVLSKDALIRWKLEQVTKACFADGHISSSYVYLTPEQYHEKMVDQAFTKVEQAADAGTLIHAALDLAFQGAEWDHDQQVFLPETGSVEPMSTFILPTLGWLTANEVVATGYEQVVVNDKEGYAGTADLPYTRRSAVGVGDYKTRKTKVGMPVKAYDTQAMQIASYLAGLNDNVIPEGAEGFNLFISTTEPGRIEAVWYNQSELQKAWEAFKACCAIWRFQKNYDPRIT